MVPEPWFDHPIRTSCTLAKGQWFPFVQHEAQTLSACFSALSLEQFPDSGLKKNWPKSRKKPKT